jgi:hypothetical protein
MMRLVSVGALLLVVTLACSGHQPGSYEGGGRTFPPIIIDGTCSGAAADGEQCMVDSDCCSDACNLEALEPVCYTPADASVPLGDN